MKFRIRIDPNFIFPWEKSNLSCDYNCYENTDTNQLLIPKTFEIRVFI